MHSCCPKINMFPLHDIWRQDSTCRPGSCVRSSAACAHWCWCINIVSLLAVVSPATMICLAVVCSLLSSVLADGPPAYGPPPSYEKEVAQPYSYQYAVQDDYSGSNFAASENSDAKVVTGSYTVHLPDGRIQTVKYTADHYNGYVADVSVSIQFWLLEASDMSVLIVLSWNFFLQIFLELNLFCLFMLI